MMKLSIITVNKDNAEGLKRTMDSVAAQTCKEFEYIVIDGASIDGGLDIVREYRFGIPYRWVSEHDHGVYEAMNKGLRLAEGSYCLFLNSGDWLYDSSVVEDFINYDCHADIVAGYESVPGRNRMFIPPTQEQLTYDYFVDNVLAHQSTFIRRELLLGYGGYNEEYRIVSDWEFWLKALIQGNATYEVFKRPVAVFDITGISNQERFLAKKREEEQRVLAQILPRVYPNSVELRELRKVKKEFDYLKNGDFGWLIKSLIRLKDRKKRANRR